MNSLSVIVRTMTIPKQGNTEEECEDSCFILPSTEMNGECYGPLVVSISDGASESMFAGVWSSMVAARAARRVYNLPATISSPGDSFRRLITQLVERWDGWVVDYIGRRAQHGPPLRWYEEAKLASGASATLLAVRIDPSSVQGGEGAWHAAALGDSCVFQVRGYEVMSRFPVRSSADFDITPNLLASRNINLDLICQRTLFAEGSFGAGDDFFLMTDALAAWFLYTVETSPRSEIGATLDVLRRLGRSQNTAHFQTWVASLIADGALRNDDVTFTYIKVLR